jgi:hypothetical protein
MVVDKWRPYLLIQPFIIKTDHKSMCHLQDQTLSTDMQRKVMTKLVGLQFKLQYKKGPENTVADALSRVGQHFQSSVVSVVLPIWIQEVLNSYSVDPNAQKLLQQLVVHSPDENGYSLHDGMIMFKGRGVGRGQHWLAY